MKFFAAFWHCNSNFAFSYTAEPLHYRFAVVNFIFGQNFFGYKFTVLIKLLYEIGKYFFICTVLCVVNFIAFSADNFTVSDKEYLTKCNAFFPCKCNDVFIVLFIGIYNLLMFFYILYGLNFIP